MKVGPGRDLVGLPRLEGTPHPCGHMQSFPCEVYLGPPLRGPMLRQRRRRRGEVMYVRNVRGEATEQTSRRDTRRHARTTAKQQGQAKRWNGETPLFLFPFLPRQHLDTPKSCRLRNCMRRFWVPKIWFRPRPPISSMLNISERPCNTEIACWALSASRSLAREVDGPGLGSLPI